MNDYIIHKSSGWTKKDHKYSLRKWINGKWRYFYDTKLGGNAKRQAMGAYITWRNSVHDADVAWDNETKQTKWGKSPDDWRNDSRIVTKKYGITKTKNEDLWDERRAKQKKRDEAQDNFEYKMYKYMNTPLGKLDQTKTSIHNAFNKLKKKSKQKKSWADTYLSEIKRNSHGAVLNGMLADAYNWGKQIDYVNKRNQTLDTRQYDNWHKKY